MNQGTSPLFNGMVALSKHHAQHLNCRVPSCSLNAPNGLDLLLMVDDMANGRLADKSHGSEVPTPAPTPEEESK